MGANIIPIVKKRGRTVLGVRIGLAFRQSRSIGDCPSKSAPRLTARPSTAAAGTPYLHFSPVSLHSSIAMTTSVRPCRLFAVLFRADGGTARFGGVLLTCGTAALLLLLGLAIRVVRPDRFGVADAGRRVGHCHGRCAVRVVEAVDAGS